MAARKRKLQPRKAGAWRDWGANIPDDVFLEPMDPRISTRRKGYTVMNGG